MQYTVPRARGRAGASPRCGGIISVASLKDNKSMTFRTSEGEVKPEKWEGMLQKEKIVGTNVQS